MLSSPFIEVGSIRRRRRGRRKDETLLTSAVRFESIEVHTIEIMRVKHDVQSAYAERFDVLLDKVLVCACDLADERLRTSERSSALQHAIEDRRVEVECVRQLLDARVRDP
jgi:hypothetical protein